MAGLWLRKVGYSALEEFYLLLIQNFTVVLTLLHWVAIASALFRLHRRRKIDQLDWDDYIAGLALALNIIYFPTLWFPNDKPFGMFHPIANTRY